MDQIEFADGFDRPDTLAFGLGAGQLAVVMVGALAAYSLARSPLPPPIADPVAVVIAIGAAGLGWLKVAGRPVLDWAVFAVLFWMRPRHGSTQMKGSPATPRDDVSTTAQRRVRTGLPDAVLTAQADRVPVTPSHAPAEDPRAVPSAAIVELFGTRAPSPLVQPKTRSTVLQGLRRDGARRVTFFSLRGGTGRSTLATELACLLASSRSDEHAAPRVALVDLDLRSPTVGIRLGTP